jgi:serpin B
MSAIQPFKTIVVKGLLLALVLSLSYTDKKANGYDNIEVIRSYNKTALQLYRELKNESKNIVISPYSIGTLMTMAFSGSQGDTEKEMKRVLNHTISRERIDSANSRILDYMSRVQKGEDLVLSIANALSVPGDVGIVQEAFINLLNTKYRAELFTGQEVDPINAWVSKKTHGKIVNILEKFNPNSGLVLLNAVYFKGLWASPFDKTLTYPGKFYTTVDKALPVPMMRQSENYSVIKHDDFMAISMPYKVGSLAMIIVLPNETEGLARVEEKLTFETVESAIDDLERGRRTNVDLSLPRFKIKFDAGLMPAFKALGMRLAFSKKKADFGGITGRDNDLGFIWIDQVHHKVIFEANEEGTEASASTIAKLDIKSRRTKFQVDHPFLFLLVDNATNAILFMGRVNNPLEKN